MTNIVALRASACPKFCVGCNKPFPVRKGRSEVQVGLDGQLYCHAMTPACIVLAVKPVIARRAA